MEVVGVVFVAFGWTQKPVGRAEAFIDWVDADAAAERQPIGLGRDAMDGPRPNLHPEQWPWILDFPDGARDGVGGDRVDVLVLECALIEHARGNRGRKGDRCEAYQSELPGTNPNRGSDQKRQ